MDHVYWLLEADIRASEADDFVALKDDLIAATRDAEPGTLDYEWSTNLEGTICYLFERYVDADAAMIHLKNFRPFARRFGTVLAPKRLTIFGRPSDEIVAALAMSNPTVTTWVGGFRR